MSSHYYYYDSYAPSKAIDAVERDHPHFDIDAHGLRAPKTPVRPAVKSFGRRDGTRRVGRRHSRLQDAMHKGVRFFYIVERRHGIRHGLMRRVDVGDEECDMIVVWVIDDVAQRQPQKNAKPMVNGDDAGVVMHARCGHEREHFGTGG